MEEICLRTHKQMFLNVRKNFARGEGMKFKYSKVYKVQNGQDC